MLDADQLIECSIYPLSSQAAVFFKATATAMQPQKLKRAQSSRFASEQAAVRTYLISENRWLPDTEPLVLARNQTWFGLDVLVKVDHQASAEAASLDIDVFALLFNSKVRLKSSLRCRIVSADQAVVYVYCLLAQGTFLESVGFNSPLSSDRSVTHGGDEV